MADAVEKAYSLAIRYLARRARSRFEMQQYLSRKSFEPDVIDAVIFRLVHDTYLDDTAFARQFIQSRIRFKPKSTYALGYELKAKGIDDALARALLEPYDDLDLAFRAVLTKQDQWRRLDPEEQKKKLMNYLRYRGFDYGVCITVWEKKFSQS